MGDNMTLTKTVSPKDVYFEGDAPTAQSLQHNLSGELGGPFSPKLEDARFPYLLTLLEGKAKVTQQPEGIALDGIVPVLYSSFSHTDGGGPLDLIVLPSSPQTYFQVINDNVFVFSKLSRDYQASIDNARLALSTAQTALSDQGYSFAGDTFYTEQVMDSFPVKLIGHESAINASIEQMINLSLPNPYTR